MQEDLFVFTFYTEVLLLYLKVQKRENDQEVIANINMYIMQNNTNEF